MISNRQNRTRAGSVCLCVSRLARSGPELRSRPRTPSCATTIAQFPQTQHSGTENRAPLCINRLSVSGCALRAAGSAKDSDGCGARRVVKNAHHGRPCTLNLHLNRPAKLFRTLRKATCDAYNTRKSNQSSKHKQPVCSSMPSPKISHDRASLSLSLFL